MCSRDAHQDQSNVQIEDGARSTRAVKDNQTAPLHEGRLWEGETRRPSLGRMADLAVPESWVGKKGCAQQETKRATFSERRKRNFGC